MSGISKSQVSRLCEEIDEQGEGLPRSADRGRLALSVDRRHLREGAPGRPHRLRRRDHRRGVNADGRREVLGMDIGPSEAETFWTEFLSKLARRGLRGVKLVISDAHEGIKAAVAKVLDATWQRCRVHFMRNVLAHAGKSGRRVVSAFIATAFAQDDAEAAKAQWRRVADQLRPKLPKLAALMDEAETDVLAYMGFPARRTGPSSTPRMRWTSRFFRSCYFGRARATSWRRAGRRLQASPGRLHSSPAGLRRPRAVSSPACGCHDRRSARRLARPAGDAHLLVAQLLDVVGVGRPALVALLLRAAGLQFHARTLVGDQGRPRPEVVRLLGQQVPAQHGELARHGHGGDLMAAPGADAHEEGVQRPRRLGRRPGRLDQHGAGVAAADLADAAVMGERRAPTAAPAGSGRNSSPASAGWRSGGCRRSPPRARPRP